MTLASKLRRISRTRGKEQAKLAAEFGYDIAGHPQERVLRECLIQAQLGQTKVRRRVGPLDETLKNEGFKVGTNYLNFGCEDKK